MKAVIQRVTKGAVIVDAKTVGSIGRGLVVLLGVKASDTAEDAAYLAEKTLNLRLFGNETLGTDAKFDLSLLDIKGELLVVSQFTLYADCRKGRRPSFTDAAPAEQAKALYEEFVKQARASGLKVETGVFQATMNVSIENQGPVTIILESISKDINNN
jgi:D-tyrosyl-tRNA(Tyr) deacylase